MSLNKIKHIDVQATNPENVDEKIIQSLENASKLGLLDASSTLKGELKTQFVYTESVDELRKFSELIITPEERAYIREYLRIDTNLDLFNLFLSNQYNNSFSTKYTERDILNAVGDFVAKNDLNLTSFKSLTYNILDSMVHIGKLDLEGCTNIKTLLDISNMQDLVDLNLISTEASVKIATNEKKNMSSIALGKPQSIELKNIDVDLLSIQDGNNITEIKVDECSDNINHMALSTLTKVDIQNLDIHKMIYDNKWLEYGLPTVKSLAEVKNLTIERESDDFIEDLQHFTGVENLKVKCDNYTNELSLKNFKLAKRIDLSDNVNLNLTLNLLDNTSLESVNFSNCDNIDKVLLPNKHITLSKSDCEDLDNDIEVITNYSGVIDIPDDISSNKVSIFIRKELLEDYKNKYGISLEYIYPMEDVNGLMLTFSDGSRINFSNNETIIL